MEEKNNQKNSLTGILLLFAIIVIVILSFFLYKIYNDKSINDEKVNQLNVELANLNKKVNLLEKDKIDKSLENNNLVDVNENAESTVVSNLPLTELNNNSNLNNDEVEYVIETKNDSIVVITAIKNEEKITEEFEMSTSIDKTGTAEIPKIGKVALVEDSGGEYLGITVFQLVNEKIKNLGTITMGANIVRDVNYSVAEKDEALVSITATTKKDNKIISQDIKMSALVDNTTVVNLLDCGNIVLIAESGGEYYGIKAYGLSQDYFTGELKDIIEIGILTGMFE